ncbi:MAG: CRISPR-associated CARF protein Csx1 [Caldimicrobium sp.]
MNLIYQIGRFDGVFNEVNFSIDQKKYPAPLSSFALKNYFLEKEKSSKVILLFPVSLLFNRSALQRIKEQAPKEVSEFKTLVQALLDSGDKREEFFKNPKIFYSKHPHSLLADSFGVIHSVGSYEGINFKSSLENLILEIFVDMVMRYLKEPFESLYLDISSGHNIYVSALIEAGRLFLTFYKLQNFLPKDRPFKVFITFSEPIVNPTEQVYHIQKDFSLEVKTFFSYPERPEAYSFEYAFRRFVKTLVGKSEFRDFLNSLFAKGYFFYSAIKNNTPLVLYTWDYHSEEEIKEGLKLLCYFLAKEFQKNYLESPEINFETFRKAFLMLALYLGLVRIFKVRDIRIKEEVPLSDIMVNFSKEETTIYNLLELSTNRPYLSQEIKNNFLKEEIKEKFTSDFQPLRSFLPIEKSDQVEPRNFIAHCGFERNCVEVKKEGDEIYLRYRKELLKRIEEILLKN